MKLLNRLKQKETADLWQSECKKLRKRNQELVLIIDSQKKEIEDLKSFRDEYLTLINEVKQIKKRYLDLINTTEKVTDDYKDNLEKIIKEINK